MFVDATLDGWWSNFGGDVKRTGDFMPLRAISRFACSRGDRGDWNGRPDADTCGTEVDRVNNLDGLNGEVSRERPRVELTVAGAGVPATEFGRGDNERRAAACAEDATRAL